MQTALIPSNEKERLESLYELKILDTLPEERFDRITRIAIRLFNVPISTITLIDSKREWFKSCQGLSKSEGERAISFCSHAMVAEDVFIIPDTTKDERFADNPMVVGEPYIRFYAGISLAGPKGINIGALCIKDRKPRTINSEDIKLLRDLASWVELELSMHELSAALSARRKAEEELRKEKQRLEESNSKNEALLSSIGDGVVAVDREGRIIAINQQAENLLFLKKEQVLGQKYYDLWRIEDDNGNIISLDDRPIQAALTTHKKMTTSQYYYVTPFKNKFPVAITAAPVIINGENSGAIGVFRDITKEKELNKLKDEFVSVASHELRTPLTAIDGIISMILSGEYGAINENLKQPLTDVNASSERLIHLVNDLLNLSRIQAGRLKYLLIEFSLFDKLKQEIELLEISAKKKNILLMLKEFNNVYVQADEGKFAEIVNNIVGNAIKFTDKGEISISVRQNDGCAEISISDSGIGITKEDQARLFGKFEQIGSNGDRTVGTGLGLYISREMAQEMGGDVWLQKSNPGEGSVFVISVPIAKSQVAYEVKAKMERNKLVALTV